MPLASFAIALAGVVVLCAGLPWAVACLLLPALEASPGARAVNWRGSEVMLGLGIVWMAWGGSALISAWLLEDLGSPSSVAAVLGTAGVLAVAASAFGLVDDAYGTGDARGFKGHLTALVRGRLTTGGLKLVGIGVASVAAARAVAGFAEWGESPIGVLAAGASVALSANLVNLLDLRPGRALKAYVVLALAGAVLVGLSAARVAGGSFVPVAALIGVALLGPAVACWRYDLGERAMLGDAGANAMGAVAGLAIVSALPLAGVVAFGAVALALNLLSERVSFSAVIERVRILAWLDGLGRPRSPDSPTGPHDDGASRYDGNGSAGDGSLEV
ncbi:hypothetical protein emb_1c0207 [Coriobacteriaceae bacterium EMTCatB1]|nr:hypothetical protein emb_1c0207 [Coriobacteriaceae bacterium EMTCatB1]